MSDAQRVTTGRLAGLRRDELSRALPLALSHGLVMAALYVLKPVRNALFLDRFSVHDLPYALLLVAALGAVTAGLYARLGARVRLERLLPAMFAAFVLCLGAFRFLVPMRAAWAVYLFYVWVALFGLVAVSLVWQLANAQFDAREARRVFGVVGTGGIAGATLGGLFTGWAASRIGSENLLLAAMGLLLLAGLGLRGGPRLRDAPTRVTAMSGGGLESVTGTRLLRLIGAMTVLTAMTAVIVDVQFNDVVQRRFAAGDDRTAFFGLFFAGLNAISILVQVFATPRILTSMGVGAALLVLPVSLGLGTGALLLAPGLLTGVLPKLGDGMLRHSVHKAAFEILFIPVPQAIKKRSKLFLDATVDAMSTGAAALLVLCLTTRLGVSYPALGLLSGSFIAAWLVVAVRARSAYVDAFRQALARRQLDVRDLTVNIAEASTVDSLLAVLDGGARRPLAFALDTLESVEDPRLEVRVLPLLRHPDAGVRRRALGVLAHQRGTHVPLVEPLLADADPDVRVEACHYLVTHAPEPADRLRALLHDADTRTRVAAVGAVARHGTDRDHAWIDAALVDTLLTVEGEEGERLRAHIVTLLGTGREDLAGYWDTFKRDPSERVVRRTIESAGRSRRPEHVDWLFSLLDDTRHRMDARLALARYGEAVVEVIDRRLADPALSTRARRTLPRILARIPSNRCVEILFEHLASADSALRGAMLQALGKLRVRFPQLRFRDADIDALIAVEIRDHYLCRTALSAYRPGAPPSRADAFLARALAERRDQALERLFTLLALRYPSRDMASAYSGLRSTREGVAASALEFLDNVLERDLKERVLPLVDPHRVAELPGIARRVLGQELTTREAVVARLLESNDPWLRACTIYALGDGPSTERWLAAAATDGHPLVRETATLVRGRLAAGTRAC